MVSLETVIELLRHTSTKEGLSVSAMVDQNIYPTGIKVTDDELKMLNIVLPTPFMESGITPSNHERQTRTYLWKTP